jgi:hypothetical protein
MSQLKESAEVVIIQPDPEPAKAEAEKMPKDDKEKSD